MAPPSSEWLCGGRRLPPASTTVATSSLAMGTVWRPVTATRSLGAPFFFFFC